MVPEQIQGRYDVVIAGTRVAGASTAMLLARHGLKVLAVDPVSSRRDTLSTHALMRGAVLQLRRWDLLDQVREAGTPTIRSTTFHYGRESTTVQIKARDGIDGLYAPRRTVLDPIIVDAARDAGADVVHGAAVTALVQDREGRVRGVDIIRRGRRPIRVHADLVIGADGRNSKVARLVSAPVDHSVRRATASIYGYWPALADEGYHWYYGHRSALGTIPTNDGATCVFVSLPPDRFDRERGKGLAGLYHETVRYLAPELAKRLTAPRSKLRGFAGAPSVLRRAAGPGWALVGDAGYFKDPLTAHGITDALRDAELLAEAAAIGTRTALAEYQVTRDRLSMGLLEVTGAIASLDWTLDEVKALHLALSREMRAEVEELLQREGASSVRRSGQSAA